MWQGASSRFSGGKLEDGMGSFFLMVVGNRIMLFHLPFKSFQIETGMLVETKAPHVKRLFDHTVKIPCSISWPSPVICRLSSDCAAVKDD